MPTAAAKTSNPPRWIDYVPLDDLKPDPRNPKAHDDALLDESVDVFGYVEPVILDERTGLLVAGHGRREMLLRRRLLHAEDAEKYPVPDGVVVTDEFVWTVPLQRGWSSRDDEHALAYLIASNRTTERGGWNDEDLMTGLLELHRVEDGLVGVGFTESEIRALVDVVLPLDALDDGGREGSGRRGAGSDSVGILFGVVIECDDEQQQLDLIARFTDEGLTVKAIL